jgi:peptidoglycan/LPS O-acetylase OafA/YrhL
MAAQREVPFPATKASVNLDVLRALAAAAVLLSHWRALLFVDYPDLHAHKLLLVVPYIVSGAGHQAVIIFFVLSGYLIGSSVVRNLRRGRWDWREYVFQRLTRLWIVLIPALVLCAVLDGVGMASHAAPMLYLGLAGNHVTPDVAASHGIREFFSNMFFLQQTAAPPYGSDGPLWSLANEFWYYLMFPCALIALRGGSKWWWRALHGVVLVLMLVLLSPAIVKLFPAWLAGAALAFFELPEMPRGLRPVVMGAYVPVFFYLAKAHFIPVTISDYVLTAATIPLMLCLLSYRSAAHPSRWVGLARRSAGFSYTVYLVHVPFLTLVTALLLHGGRWRPGVGHFGVAVGILAVTVAYAYGVASVTEFRTAELRGFARARLGFLLKPDRQRARVAE